MKLLSRHLSDYVGISSAFICMIHCMATPILLSLTPGLITNRLVVYLFLFIGLIAVFKTTEKSKSIGITVWLWLAFGGFLFSTLLEDDYPLMHYSSYLWATGIIVGHILHIRHCKYHKN